MNNRTPIFFFIYIAEKQKTNLIFQSEDVKFISETSRIDKF